MNINIGTIIKSLRTKKHITQKQLATYLGVTEQAVSRWESDGGFPDIQLLPSIASYFSVSTDTLLGINMTEREKRLAEIHNKIDEIEELCQHSEETLSLARQWTAEFPGDEDIQLNLADELSISMWSENPKHGLFKEAEKIYRTLIDTTNNAEFRNRVIENLTALYLYGFKDPLQAEQTADLLPSMKYCKESVKACTFSNWIDDHPEDHLLLCHYQDYMERLVSSLDNSMTNYIIRHIPNSPDRWDEKIGYLKKIIDLYDMFFGENKLFYHRNVADLYRVISTYTVAQGKYKETLENLEKMTENVLKADLAKMGDQYTSPFMDQQTFPDNEDFDTLKVHNNAYYFREMMDRNRYDPIREEPRFKNICKKLEENMH